MNKAKKDLLEETHYRFMQVGFNQLDPAILEDIVNKSVMGFGTTFDEKIFSLHEMEELLTRQHIQTEGLKMTWDFKLLYRHVSSDENTAVYADDLFLHVEMENETLEMYMRFSIVLEYINDQWLVVHWHGSKPEEVESEKDTFGIDTWKEKAEALEKIVEKRTADLVIKNRELEIETALERVRAKTMAMQHSGELADTASVLFQQIKALGFETWSCGFCIWQENELVELWMGADSGGLLPPMLIPYKQEITHKKIYEASQRGEISHDAIWEGAALNGHYNFLRSIPSVKEAIDVLERSGLSLPEKQCYYVGFFEQGYLLLITKEPNKDLKELSKRFAKVFEQTYTRFLDLQKAEAQARESQIQLALERVRARTMAMQHSDELLDAATVLFKQIESLGAPVWNCSFNIWKEDKKEAIAWNGTKDGFGRPFNTPSSKDVFFDFYNASNTGDELYIKEMGGKELELHYKFLSGLPGVGTTLKELKDAGVALPVFQVFNIAYFTQGYLMFITFEPIPEFANIFKRFAKVFEQTYTRFLDLQKAEAQTRESQIQLSLERVRARTMAMQYSGELADASFVLDSQVRSLGIKTWGCAFNIYGKNESTEWFSSEMGTMPAYKTPRENVFLRYYEAGQAGEAIHIETFEGETCAAHYDYLCTLPVLGDALKNVKESGGSFPVRQIDHVTYFKYGYLLFITLEPAPEAHDIFIRFAKIFEQTYTRFLDLQKAEAQTLRAEQDLIEIKKARKKAEETLSELRATQHQLIQSEKMASLGELTAGIAHEIQNPLNFVNNFSEVSAELIDEMKDELSKSNYEEANEIANDLKQNLDKINHHGKRADAIVKGMLQHSRSNSGQKESTNINALADEYLRLAYHGLRAKDNSFNATLKTDFDNSIGKINIIPQDIGRVILNLITNAFYAVDEKKKLLAQELPIFQRLATLYDPAVSVSTKKINNKIEIKVADNGNGIPQNIVDKIFQPFFTTKPTGLGTGLGLSLAYDIIKAHGGEIKVETKESEGTTFIIQLPSLVL